jgi:DNA helicase HerA-like ATPase
VIAVLARLVFEASQRYQKHQDQGKALPTVLVLEEAHTFVHRGGGDDANIVSPTRLCREAFERIAREGRKFGLGLVLSSQRPSELSPTVLAQCNTFLLHRIDHDSDQDLVSRLVPDNVGGLIRELPSLPSRQAILLGWATPIPVLVEVDELPEQQRPRSADPDFWDVWTLAQERTIDWSTIAKDWSGENER